MEQIKEFNCVAIPNNLENHTLIFNYEVGLMPPSRASDMAKSIRDMLRVNFPNCKIILNLSNDKLKLTSVKVEKDGE